VIAFDKANAKDQNLLRQLNEAIRLCAEELEDRPIRRPRPNEVGNDVEPYVMRALKRAGLNAVRPTSAGGTGKSTGYPDILVYDAEDRPTYLECKVFAHGKPDTTMRSFYLSPSESFKVSLAQLPHRCASGDLKPAEFRGLAEGQAICGAKSALPLCWNPAARLDSERVAVVA
jgi:hypothetical protein